MKNKTTPDRTLCRDTRVCAVLVSGPFALVNLKPNTEYTTKILARNRAGISEYTDHIVVRTLPMIVNSGVSTMFEGLVQQLPIIATAFLATKLYL